MSYNISNTSGSLGIVILDGTVNTTTDITLVGKNYSNYGTAQNENFLYLLEHFANTAAPVKPIAGELWFNTTTSSLKMNMYDGINWKSLATEYITTPSNPTAPANPTVGDLWYDQTSNQLQIYNGTAYTLVGPQSVTGYGTTQMKSTLVNGHAIQEGYANGNLVFTVSSDADFTPSPAINGFTTISQGITVNSNYKLNATAANALTLNGHPSTDFILASGAFFQNLVTMEDVGLDIGTGQIALRLYADPAHNGVIENPNTPNVSLKTSAGTAISLVGQNTLPGGATSTLGTSVNPWYNVYANTFTGIATQATALNIGGLTYYPTTASTYNTVAIRDINANINASTFTGNLVGNATGNSATSTTWAAPITISLTGAISGSVSVNGSTNVTMATTSNLATVPSGLIAQWFGNVSTVPAGWHICNGTSGTPDLSLDTQAISGGVLYYIMKL